MADVGIGIARKLVDSDGDALDDGAGRLNVNVASGHSTMVAGTNNAIGTSTAEQLNGATDGTYSVACKHIDLMASIANTGLIYVGGLSPKPTEFLSIVLYAGDVYSIDIDNVGDIWVLASIAGEDIQFIYYN